MYTLKKSLGQHFLKDERIIEKILGVLRDESFNQLLEVGPGGGALTRHLLQWEDIRFRAVDLDAEKVAFLEQTYPEIQGKIIHQSVLDMEKPFEGPFTVIGNFPYNISSQILFKILDWKEDVQCVISMFQKEMAQRVAAPEGSKVYGVISVLVQAWFDVTYLFDVNPGSFHPPPKVVSGVIRLLPKKERFAMKSDKDFSNLVKMSFNQRRKTLRNAVRSLFDAAVLEDPLFNKRAEQLSVADFAELSFRMK